ncbi:MAG: hypothetical protein J6B87_05850 [Clostridia bacterium]|nr:hypothetical protein [Clostridia bacterium]
MWMISLVLIVTLVLIVANYYLGAKLYMAPQNSNYFNNVKEINANNLKDITPAPKYVFAITILNAALIGMFFAICGINYINGWIPFIYAAILIFLYVIEVSRSISVNQNTLILSRFLKADIIIPIVTIEGMYIYSFNKKFLKKHALTTKLVITASGKRYKFTISSLENKAVLSMMKNCFGITDYKMFIAKQ